MTAPLEFASIEQILVAWLPTVTGTETAAELPHDFQNADGPTATLPIDVVDRISGANLQGSPLLDRPVIDVDSYAGSRLVAQQNGERVRNRLCFVLPGLVFPTEFGNAVFTRTRVIVAPRQLPHANRLVYRYAGNYELLFHMQS